MKNVYSMLLVALLLASKSAIAEYLTDVKDKLLTSLITDSEVLAKLERKSSPYYIRIVRLREHGECDGDLTSCPQESLYIAVSSYDEYPEQKVYVLPKAYGWKFSRWHNIPKQESPDGYVTISLKKKEIINIDGNPQWKESPFEVSVNLKKAFIIPLARK